MHLGLSWNTGVPKSSKSWMTILVLEPMVTWGSPSLGNLHLMDSENEPQICPPKKTNGGSIPNKPQWTALIGDGSWWIHENWVLKLRWVLRWVLSIVHHAAHGFLTLDEDFPVPIFNWFKRFSPRSLVCTSPDECEINPSIIPFHPGWFIGIPVLGVL